ncbi:MAG: hypothetical protein AAFR23_07275 [Pseudomonadota bacterium]
MAVMLSMTLGSTAIADAGGERAQTSSAVPAVGLFVRTAKTVKYSPKPSVMAAPQNQLLVPVQGRACRICRRGCVIDYKHDCYESRNWCRRQFTLCMRDCWYDYCR